MYTDIPVQYFENHRLPADIRGGVGMGSGFRKGIFVLTVCFMITGCIAFCGVYGEETAGRDPAAVVMESALQAEAGAAEMILETGTSLQEDPDTETAGEEEADAQETPAGGEEPAAEEELSEDRSPAAEEESSEDRSLAAEKEDGDQSPDAENEAEDLSPETEAGAEDQTPEEEKEAGEPSPEAEDETEDRSPEAGEDVKDRSSEAEERASAPEEEAAEDPSPSAESEQGLPGNEESAKDEEPGDGRALVGDVSAPVREDEPAFTGSVYVELVNRGTLHYGDIVTLRAVVSDVNRPYRIRWEKGEDGIYTFAAEGETYSFTLTKENAGLDYRAVLVARE